MIPMFAEIVLVILLVLMARPLKAMKPKPILPMLCIAQTVLAIFVVLSEVWKFGVFSAFLSFLVYQAYFNQQALPKWAFGVIVALQFFNILAILGPASGTTNGVFVPLGVMAADGSTTSWTAGMVDYFKGGATCSKFYDNYYTLESVEIKHKGADPNVKYWGLCADAWVTFVIVVIAFKMVVQVIMTGLSAKMYAEKLADKIAPEEKQTA